MRESQRVADEVTIVLGGEAGQGVQTIEQVLDHVLARAGYWVFSTSEFMSRIRGGSNSTLIRVSSRPCAAFVDRVDICVPLDKDALPHLAGSVGPQTVVIGDMSKVQPGRQMVDVPLGKIAEDVGGKIFENTVAAGVLLGILGVNESVACDFLAQFFASKSPDIVTKNCEAVRRGMAVGRGLSADGKVVANISRDRSPREELLLSGVDAVSMGAIAGGCNFVSSYPMSPSTGVLTLLGQQGRECGIVVEQAEDEIAAINMVLGSWYAGGRGLVTTAGGGFALMCESVSLAGMTETPAVIHIGQRPGPATGLPTRTEQADLELALYSGHGEFPRIILAPGTLEEGFVLTQRAFNLADKYQIPVFILTDQYYLDSYSMTKPFDIASVKNERHIVPTPADYKRYALTPTGISPRGVPGNGEGIVACDSDEHTEAGYITEDAQVRVDMMNKRLRKMDLIAKEIIPPRFEGPADYETLVVCWGSTYHGVKEAIEAAGQKKAALLHFGQVYPIDPAVKQYFTRAKRSIIVENNATGQFARLLKLHAGVDVDKKVLKYDGHPFSVEELAVQFS
jgi:2-oxoglutarate/2-oxoacid ferredoxin oxidoreductase subunit alpha